MPAMSPFEAAFCRSAPWRLFARRLVLPWALQGVRPHGRVLEIGAGSGAMAAELLVMFDDITMCVTDFDDAMVSAAAERLAVFGDRVECRQADATALPFPDDSFDTVLSWIMLHHTMAWEKALGEAARVLCPGGRLIGYDLLASRPFELLHQAEGEGHQMIRSGELEPVLDSLPLDDIRTERGLGGLVVRFRATGAERSAPPAVGMQVQDENAAFDPLGPRSLKGVSEPVELFEVRTAEERARKVPDPVCGMELDEATAEANLTWQGKRLLFCSEACLRRFVENPGRYDVRSSGN